MKAEFIDSINHISSEDWNALSSTDYPFLRHEFLSALENSQSVSADTGWQPHHCSIKGASGQLLAAMPLYIKYDSYGEYVFDWGWAEAYQRNGLDYYPKLLNAIPFTPATGPRYLIRANGSETLHDITQYLWQSLVDHTEQLKFSSCHSLFIENPVDDSRFLMRTGCQFHWHNQSFENFDDFLATFTSRKRKNLKKERRQVSEAGIRFQVKMGNELSEAEWCRFVMFYQTTYLKRSGHQGYLSPEFFLQLGQTMGEQVVVIQALKDNDWIASALCFKDSDTLYGRYWGCLESYSQLHFETCYYQGIEYAIANKLQRFDPGAQGEHKIQRGFEPILTQSYHYLSHPEFREAIEHFVSQEQKQVAHYQAQARELLPFKNDE